MGELQKMFESTLDKKWRTEVLFRVIKTKLDNMGITMSSAQVDSIRNKCI